MNTTLRNGLSCSEAGKIGYLKSKEKLRLFNEKRKKEYLRNPQKCFCCKKTLEFSKRKNRFCSCSCSAKINNLKRKVIVKCQYCKKDIFGFSKRKFCSYSCSAKFKRRFVFLKWQEGTHKGWNSKTVVVSRAIKEYLFEKYKRKCCLCGWGKKNLYTKRIPLQVHHIDGDAKNCKEKNLQLLCPNCHSLTKTFGRNGGHKSSRTRYERTRRPHPKDKN